MRFTKPSVVSSPRIFWSTGMYASGMSSFAASTASSKVALMAVVTTVKISTHVNSLPKGLNASSV